MDAGQSGVRTRLGGAALPELPGVRTSSPVLPQLADAARQALTAVSAAEAEAADCLAVGTTALRSNSTAAELLALVADLGIKHVSLAHDSVTSHLGALRGQRGAIVASGTGSVAFAIGASSVARVDGWGNIIGDAGSGFWIGRAGIVAVMRAHDGRGPATMLSPAVEAEFPDIEAAYLDLQNDLGYVRRVASYAKLVAELAASDAVCAAIIDEAAAELAHSAIIALRRVGEDAAATTLVSIQGKIFLNDRLRTRFDQLIRDALPGASFVPPLGDGLDGASMLFDLPDASPLRAMVSYA